MNISYNWLKELIDFDFSAQELAEKLTNAGVAVDSVEPFGEDDYVLTFDLTSNRSDCLSHLGIAREVRALTGNHLKSLVNTERIPSDKPSDLVRIEASDCYRFTARIIKGVKVGSSPDWLVRKLEAVGERSINNIADITNYVMHELGQPMHAFDLDRLEGSRIIVRRARKGEKIKTLDGVERTLDDTMLAICDVCKPVAIAGIMGGEESGICEETTNVLLEVAYFDKNSIRQTSRRLKLSTQASYRFERGVDIENLIQASNRATELICEIAGGVDVEFVDIYPARSSRVTVELRPDRVRELTGVNVEREEILRILSLLGFILQGDFSSDKLSFEVPSWRHDISIEEDLIEEVIRIVGYDSISEELAPSFGAGEYQPNEARKRNLRKVLTDLGFSEAICYSFIDISHDEQFELASNFVNEGLDEKFITLKDSIIEGAVRMRPTLLPGLLDSIRRNFNYGQRNVRLFEIGRAFAALSKEHGAFPVERELFAIAMTGGYMLQNKALPIRELDFYDAKGALEAAFDALNLPEPSFKPENVRHLRTGQSAAIYFGDRRVGTLGRLSDSIAQKYKFRQPVFVAEVDLELLLSLEEEKVFYKKLPSFPSIVRDVAFLVSKNLSFAEIRRAIKEQEFPLLSRIEFVEVYEGREIPEDMRSLTIRLEYRSEERTLKEEEVEAVNEAVIEFLKASFGVVKRFS
ncbi:MAG: phenylalanine--tRNA ligase subunit beta [Pyrinomonadaceae bacterium]|nr:phenylalanine--tRNA ligase subunit beta [Pyrinomonadaceae bacterium]MCX7638940.1 phenylalanine--tRNA ligase subunit beta [Pyrinomonadaceae bacterium]MDW8304923.1 phenylalanine--tRNA ligase subunit beta [Acidobacteriota bacterium]